MLQIAEDQSNNCWYILSATSTCNYNRTAVYKTLVNHRQKDLDIIDLLCQFGAYNNIGDTLLTKAVKNSEKFKIQRLLDDKANINTTAANGWTSLMHATFLGKLDIVKDLVERGANINLKKQGRKKCVNDSNRKPLVRYRPVFIGERRQRLYKK